MTDQEYIDLIDARIRESGLSVTQWVWSNLGFQIMKETADETPSLSDLVAEAQKLDPRVLRKKANLNWASIWRKRFERPGGV